MMSGETPRNISAHHGPAAGGSATDEGSRALGRDRTPAFFRAMFLNETRVGKGFVEMQRATEARKERQREKKNVLIYK